MSDVMRLPQSNDRQILSSPLGAGHERVLTDEELEERIERQLLALETTLTLAPSREAVK